MNAQANIASRRILDNATSVGTPDSLEIAAIVPAQQDAPAYFPNTVGNVVNRGGLAPWQRKKVVAFIEENLSLTIRIEQLAELVRLSISHFSRAFRLTFGQPPYGYILLRRMSYAKELMIGTSTSLSQIALDCGMTDQAHFCKVFKKTFGTSPNRWRGPNRETAIAPSVRTVH
ncbi:AraC family transcriptional regulator [Mesorhizobium sp. M1409]|uniref:helix-turn-helix domain-containing protein n=1 Tax=unclassified Mesorhizobium TaxID=325217 RepID=UPI00333ADA2D